MYPTIITCSAILGGAIGSVFAGKIITYGRRKSLFIFTLISSVTIIPTLFLNIYLIVFGRLLTGFCGGVLNAGGMRMLEESVPPYLISTYGPLANVLFSAGLMIADLMGFFVPTDLDGMLTTNTWKIVFGVPWIFQII